MAPRLKTFPKKLLGYLASPIVLGFILTLLMTATAFNFYNWRDRKTSRLEDHPIMKLFNIVDQKSLDLRLQARGARAGSPRAALLAIDEKSVRTVGRWPWPREVLGNAIDQAVKNGAKVMAFDIVFAEPSSNPARDLYDKLVKAGEVSPRLQDRLQTELKSSDSDKIFSEVIRKNADKLVMGTFYEGDANFFRYNGPATACFNLIFEDSPAFSIWNKEQVLLGVADDSSKSLPETIAKLYKSKLQKISEEYYSSKATPKNSGEADEYRLAILGKQLEACDQFLNFEQDDMTEILAENWAAIQGEEESLKSFATFQAWADDFKDSSVGNHTVLADHWVMNTALISAGAKHTGYFNANLDDDGSIRRSRLIVRTGNHYMPSIALKAYLVGNDFNANVEMEDDPKMGDTPARKLKSMTITNNETGDEVYSVPADSEGNLMINYAGPGHMFEYASLGDLTNNDPNISVSQKRRDKKTGRWEMAEYEVPKAEFFKDKFFIIGATATGIYDLRVTPFDENFPGAETHVNVLDNLLRRDFLKTSPREEQYMLIGLLVLGAILSLALSKLGALPGVVLTIGVGIGTLLIDHYFLFGKGWVVSVMFPLILTVITYVGLTFYKYFTEERNKRELKNTFQKYVSPAIVNEILKDPTNLELGGRKERITVFFSDLRGFTTISEKLDPSALSDLLNSYLTPMTELVFKNRGTLDKYMGDAIMAFFGAPISYGDHAKFAARCALESLVTLRQLQAEYKAKGLPDIDMGIGLNTGEASVGNMGSQTVRNYTVMGDTVNLGSRLEGINKEYGTRIVISEFTYEDIKDTFVCRELDLVRVKGKLKPVRIYELVAEGKAEPKATQTIKHFDQGFQLYLQKKWDEALEAFNGALGFTPDDEPSKLYIERCLEFQKNPPPAEWDGVFVMTTK